MNSVLLFTLCFVPGSALKVTHDGEHTAIYDLKPLWPELGASVENIDLGAVAYDGDFVESLKQDIKKHGILLFKRTSMTPAQQVELSTKLGQLPDFTKLRKHDPILGVTRFSNNASLGRVDTAQEWHTHGTWMPETHPYLLFRSVKSIENGSTEFVSLKDLFLAQSKSIQERWRQLHFIERNGMAQPFIRKLHQTNDETMAFHLVSQGKGFVRNFGFPNEQLVPHADMKRELEAAIENSKLVHALEWADGDVALIDNRALAHKGHESTPNELPRILDVTNIQAISGNEDIEVQRNTKLVPMWMKSKLTGIPETSLVEFAVELNGECNAGEVCCSEDEADSTHATQAVDPDAAATALIQLSQTNIQCGNCKVSCEDTISPRKKHKHQGGCPYWFSPWFLMCLR